MLSLEPWTLFWTVFNVLVLFLAMKKFLLKPVMGVIEKRESMIRQQFDEAENAKNQAQAMKEAYTKQLETAHAQADEIITSARARADKEHSQAMEETRKESMKMLDQARKDIESQQEKATQELKSQIADLAMTAARKIILTGDVHDAGSKE